MTVSERKLTVYWCPRCEVQSERMFHFCAKGPPLFPQLDEHTRCEEVAVLAIDALLAYFEERGMTLTMGEVREAIIALGGKHALSEERVS